MMKHTKSAIRSTCTALPQVRFEDQHLTSFSGLIVFQKLFNELSLKARLGRCFAHRSSNPVYPSATLVLLLIVHLLLGYRQLRHLSYYRDDPLVLRLLGLTRLPHVATVSRQLSALDDTSVCHVEQLQQHLVLEQLASLALARVTLDFDGSVISTCRHAEGVATGWNRKKRGQRSYYPLLCNVAQTAQVLAVKHRSGNVHDSRGAKAFMLDCIANVRER